MYYLMKRPFDIGTFPEVTIETFLNLNYRVARFYCAIKTKTPLSSEDIYKYELKVAKELNKDWIC